jgi:transcriptional regulator with XRE-family HTH domain
MGLSLSEMSERCGVEKGALSRLENGLNVNPTLDTLRRCAEALGKALRLELADREGAAAPPGPSETDPAPESLRSVQQSIDPRNGPTPLAKAMFYAWMMETQVQCSSGNEPVNVDVPADLRSDFAQLFASYTKWMARMGPLLGYPKRD